MKENVTANEFNSFECFIFLTFILFIYLLLMLIVFKLEISEKPSQDSVRCALILYQLTSKKNIDCVNLKNIKFVK